MGAAEGTVASSRGIEEKFPFTRAGHAQPKVLRRVWEIFTFVSVSRAGMLSRGRRDGHSARSITSGTFVLITNHRDKDVRDGMRINGFLRLGCWLQLRNVLSQQTAEVDGSW